jgi:asparagine synthase (glutamine-hydrolysing)
VIRINENDPGPKTAKFFQKARDGKLLMRKVMEKYVPEEISRAEKQGFSAPDASWFRGESINYVKKILYDGNARIYDILDSTAVHKLLDEHLEGKQNRRLFIWSLLNLEWWLRKFIY